MSIDKCQLCSKLGASESPKYSTLDDRKTHARFHLFQLGYIVDDSIALRRVFEQCFLSTEMFVNRQMKTANGNNEEEKGKKSQWTLLELCRTMIKNQNDPTSFCRVCKSNVQCVRAHSANGRSSLDADSLLKHASSHLTTKPYQCPYCEYGSIKKTNVTRHVKQTAHACSASTVEVRDASEYWSANFDEIVAALGKCFDRFDSAATIRSDLRSQQLARCSGLLNTYANREKNLRCILCRKWISTYGRGSYELLRHIHGHLNKAIFKCKRCSATFNSRQIGGWHVSSRHKNSSAKDIIEDVSDKYHSEIMQLATNCFDMKTNL